MPAAASRSIREVFRDPPGRWEALEGASELVHGTCRPFGQMVGFRRPHLDRHGGPFLQERVYHGDE